MQDDPLSELLLDADEVDRAQLAEALHGIVGVDSSSGRVVLKPGFASLKSREKVVAFLMGVKASTLLGKSDVAAVPPKDIASQTGMPHGTVNPSLMELREKRIVSRTSQGEYYLEAHQVLAAVNMLKTRV